MAAFKVSKFKDIEALQKFLVGGVEGGKGLLGGVEGLTGKTLIFNAPVAGPVTFVDGAHPPLLTLAEIITQTAAGTTNAVAAGFTGENARLTLVEASPTGGVDVDATGTANALLGFSTTADTVGTFYAYDPSATPTAPCFVDMEHDCSSNSLILVTWE
jgi:hypothetical protein